MPVTRHSARSSFTFEIKRASRPRPEVLNRRKTSLFAGPSLADQVFGKFAGSSTGPQFDGSPAPTVEARSGPLGIRSSEKTGEIEPGPRPAPRRMLPDLLSAP